MTTFISIPGTSEVSSASVGVATVTGVGATTVYGAVTSLTLAAGRWLITGSVGAALNGATMTTYTIAGISGSATGVGIDALDVLSVPSVPTSGADISLSLLPKYVDISSETTYYLNTKFTYSAGTPKHYGKLVALRVL